jgi:hypothetical protein
VNATLTFQVPFSTPFADKQTFPQQDVVGWYATGAEITDNHMNIQRKVGAGCQPVLHGVSWLSCSPSLPCEHCCRQVPSPPAFAAQPPPGHSLPCTPRWHEVAPLLR